MGMSDHINNTFYCVDLDRTLFDTEKGADLMIAIAAAEDPRLGELFQANRAAYIGFGVGLSFYDTIVERAGETAAAAVASMYILKGGEQLLLPGAKAFLGALKQRAPSRVGILTYGSQRGQRLKVAAAHLSAVPLLVTDQPHKGELMTDWKTSYGFELPEAYGKQRVERVVLIDDRPQSFEGLPEGAAGYWLAGDVTALDEVPLPAGVVTVKSLTEVLKHEAMIDKA